MPASVNKRKNGSRLGLLLIRLEGIGDEEVIASDIAKALKLAIRPGASDEDFAHAMDSITTHPPLPY